MKFVAGLTVACFAAWLAATWLGAPGREVLLGMLGPLAATAATWILAKRMCRRKPEQLTAVMIGAFGAKLVFFGAYVVVMLKALALDPIPFIVSFTIYYIALHLTGAVGIRRLMANDLRASQ
jgi:hypothetical protein